MPSTDLQKPTRRKQRLTLLLAVLAGTHLAIGALRLVRGSVLKRARVVAEYQEAGPAWHFRMADEETQRIASWLLATVPEDHALLFDGDGPGCLQLLAPLLFPRLLVHANALRSDGTAAGRPVFRGQPPWLEDAPADVPVVVGHGTSLEWTRR